MEKKTIYIDLFLPDYLIAISFDSYYNKSKGNVQEAFDKALVDRGITPFRVRSEDIDDSKIKTAKVFKRYTRYDLDLSRVIKDVIRSIDPEAYTKISVDVNRDNYLILAYAVDLYKKRKIA